MGKADMGRRRWARSPRGLEVAAGARLPVGRAYVCFRPFRWAPGGRGFHSSTSQLNVSTYSGLHTSTSQLVVSTFYELGCVFESQKWLRLGWSVDASCGFNDQTWLRLS